MSRLVLLVVVVLGTFALGCSKPEEPKKEAIPDIPPGRSPGQNPMPAPPAK